MRSQHEDGKLVESVDLGDCILMTLRYDDSREGLATIDSESLIRSQIYCFVLGICHDVSWMTLVSKNETL